MGSPTQPSISQVMTRVISRYLRTVPCEPDHLGFHRLGTGLINDTYLIEPGAPRSFVAQRVNPIFDSAIHHNIAAVTRRLAERGVETPVLLETDDGQPFVDLGDAGLWRLMTYIDGASFDTVRLPEQARAAAALVGRFHAALDGLDHAFVGLRVGVHDTQRHLDHLRAALSDESSHRLYGVVRPLAEGILEAAAALPPLPDLPPRVCHGDLKFSNVVFAGAGGAAALRPRALVDLDTLAPMPLGFELGDAWRSWCNPRGEDSIEAIFDLQVFAASLDGYLAGVGRALDEKERAALLGGVEWVSVELAARFCADALQERYFGWDARRFRARGEHNLARAVGQWSLHQAVMACRPERERLLGLSP